jgi:hypothetical protein
MASCRSVLFRFLGWDGEAFIFAMSRTCGKSEKVNSSPSRPPHPGSTWIRLPIEGDSSPLIRTRCTQDLFPGSNARVYFHALGQSGRLAGMCYADLRDQPSSFIRMYRRDVFSHSTSNPEKQTSLRYSTSGAFGVASHVRLRTSAASIIYDTPNVEIRKLVK